MIDKLLPRGSKRRKTANLLAKPFFGPFVRLMHVKVGGKQIFINRYTKKIPVLDKIINFIERRTIFFGSIKELEKEYKRWFGQNFPNKKELQEQSKKQKLFNKQPLISILVPTYDTKPNHLRACIDSVFAQTYENWQLCIADDASTDDSVKEIIEEYVKKDKRVNKKFRAKNGHICEASNSALQIAQGEYVALLDHDDYLWPNALYEVVNLINCHPGAKFIYSDEDKVDEHGKKHSNPFFKPDWSPDFLRSINYITHFAVLDRKLVNDLGGFRKGYEGAQDWDLFLRASRKVKNIHHIPKILYSWRMTDQSTAKQPSAKDYAYVNQKKALEDDIKARRLKAEIKWQIPFSMWRVSYELKEKALISIIIPTKDQHQFIERCLSSIKDKTTYSNYEIIVVDTGSSDKKVWDLYDEYAGLIPKFKVVKWTKPFNFSSACNFGVQNSEGDFLLFLNNDTEVISETWLEDMLGYAQQEEIGAVGCKLYYPDGKVQHAGIVLGVGGQEGTPGIAGHLFPAYLDNPPQSPVQDLYMGGTRNFTAVTAACVMVSKNKFNEVRGFDSKFKIAFNDVDLCLKLFDKGLRNVYLPHVQIYHYESISVGKPGAKQRDLNQFSKEIQLMLKKWQPLIEDDPFYHPEFRRDLASARVKIK
ncbi:MAG TPA: glycosyltransferase family 2 protein [Patescibacteria group bacterium]|nr:glycosyltransferase family 2 protein [Patescibacteria group bacterium]